MKRLILPAVLAIFCSGAFAAQPVVVHEWGTFTSLQDETGRAVGYLNSSTERLPQFVHRLRSNLIVGDRDVFYEGKGVSAKAHPDVTMRLETPVIYFHPADKNAEPFNVDITATMQGGVLSEYYPGGAFHIEGGFPAPAGIERISASTQGSVIWKSLRVGGDVKIPETKEHVWLAPRQVDSAPVAAGKEGERYVFYRGVAHLDAPLRVIRNSSQGGDQLEVHSQVDAALLAAGPLRIEKSWLVDTRGDGTCAMREVPSFELSADRAKSLASLPGQFDEKTYSSQQMSQLRQSMKAALKHEGLFDDEAEAMLNTWEQSYFKSAGLRLFFIVPRAWTDRYLPLKISVSNELTRVMVGRIEVLSAPQRDSLNRLADAKLRGDAKPEKLYATLGRFGYALVLDELRQRPNDALAKFASQNGIRALAPPTTQPVAVLGTSTPAAVVTKVTTPP